MIQINGTLTISDPVRLNGRVVVNQQIEVGGVVMTLATYLRLVQETGDDTFAVMSQEAVTRLMQEKLVSGQNIKTINGESVLGSGNIEVGGGGGTADYDELTHKPQVNGVTLSGNKTSSDLGVASASHTHTVSQITDFPTIPDELSDLADDSTHRLVTDSEKSAWDGKYDKPAGGIPKTDLDSSVQTSLGKADTALQTETDPTVPSWAKQSSKPTYDYSEITNTPTIPTVNDATLKIQRNGTDLDTFTANAAQDKMINIVVPTTASDVSALPASTKYGASLSLSINSSTYVITAQLKDQDNNDLGSAQTIDLPLESVVVNGSYDDATKKIILTLQNGNTIEFSVADLVNGLQTEITANNPLSADLIADGTTNKVYTATEKGKLSGIEAGAEVNVQSDWNQSDNTADDFIKNKPTIPTDTGDLTNGAGYITSADIPPIPNGTYVDIANAGWGPNQVTGAYLRAAYFYNGEMPTKVGDYVYSKSTRCLHKITSITQVGGENVANADFIAFFSGFDGSYSSLSGKPTLGTAAALDVPASGDAATTEVVKGDDSRLTDARTPTSHTHTKSEITDFPSLATVATSGDYDDLQNKPTIPAAQVNSDWDAVSGVAQILNKPTIPDAVSGTNDGTNWTTITIGSVTKAIPSGGGGGGLSNYDFTELSAPTISGGACTITFAADQRNAVEFSTNADLAIALVSNNKADNYIWITNSHATTAIDITFSSILFGSTAINDIKGTASIPSIEAGETLEIGIYVTNSKARITSRIL